VIVENSGGLSAALAEFVRRISPVVLIMVAAYVLLGIFAKPSGPPMPFKGFFVLVVGYDVLEKLLRYFLHQFMTRSKLS